MEEIWKDIIGFEGIYQISNQGRVKNVKLNLIRNPHLSDRGYHIILLRNKKISKTARIHRLVAIHFIPNPENKEHVNHLDFNPLNNCVENLEWVTNRENSYHYHLNNPSNKSSKYIGVHRVGSRNKWVSNIRFQGKRYSLGYFNSEEEAYQARIQFEADNGIKNKYV